MKAMEVLSGLLFRSIEIALFTGGKPVVNPVAHSGMGGSLPA
jgi:hypothetical protein